MRQIRLLYFFVLLVLTLMAAVSYVIFHQARLVSSANVQQLANLEWLGEILLFVAFGTLIVAALATFRMQERRLLQREAELRSADKRQQALLQDRLRLATIVESLNDAIIGKTLDGIITSWNPAAERLYGYQAAEIIGKSILMLVPEDEPEDVIAILNKIRRGERVERYETQRKRKDGRIITVSLTVSPIRDERGVVTGAATIAYDITSLKAHEREAFRLAVEQENLRIITNFIHDTSHEFRTPLTIIQTASYLLSRTNDANKRQERIDDIQEQIKHLSKLIDQFQLMVLLQSADYLDLTSADVNDVVKTAHESLGQRAYEKRLKIRLELQPDLPSIRADMRQLHIAVSSLLENAILYTPEGGSITVSTSLGDRHICISVRDNGIGISPEDLPHIFDRLYKADKARPLNHSGMGLGLAMAKAVVEAHHGSIGVESVPGQGSVFTVELPLKPQAVQETTAV